jgi:hypothetical protein
VATAIRKVETRTGSSHADVVAWYREALAEPAVFPWLGTEWEPVRVGPTWQTTEDGHWLLPEATIGWDVLGWCGTELQLTLGEPWRFTLEQARFVLHWYSVDELGRWVYTDGVLQRLKGWGKDPMAGCLSYVEALGPCRVAYMENDQPVATDCPTAWVQLPAVSLEQTKNTMRLMPGLITPAAKAFYGVQIGKELIHACGDERLIQAVTSSPTTLEGARATAVFPNETQHWKQGNDGHEMAQVIERNATKSADGAARRLAITNAYEPSEDSVAQRDREAWEAEADGKTAMSGIMYDSLEAPPDAPLALEQLEGESREEWDERTIATVCEVVRAIRGDSYWLDPRRIAGSVLDPRNPPSRSRRFWYNQITATEDAWVDPLKFDGCVDVDVVVADGDELALFFDGSKSDDATALVACRISDGHVVTKAMWQKPPKGRADGWIVPRGDVDAEVERIFATSNVVAFFADPSHTLDDETQDRFWDGLIDEWHRRYKDRLRIWAVPGKSGHAVMWDMTSPARSAEFTAAAERCAGEIERGELTHDGDGRLRRHVHNAKRYPNRYGVSLWKGHRESPRKIDLAVCMVGARMVRRVVLNGPQPKKRTGRAIGY